MARMRFGVLACFVVAATVAPAAAAGASTTLRAAGSLGIVSRDTSHITIKWTDRSSGETGYAVERAQGAGTFAQLSPLTTKNIERFADNGLIAGTAYKYRVRAFHDRSNGTRDWGPYSSTLSTSTTGTAPDTTPPPVPTGLSVTAASCTQLNIGWAASSATDLHAYNLYRGGVLLKQVLAPGTATTDAGLRASTTYSYALSAVDNAGNESAKSSAVSMTTSVCPDATPPSTPAGLAAVAASCSQINLTWAASTDTGGSNLKGYNVYRGGVLWKFVGVTSTTDPAVAASTAFSYAVSAVDNANNESARSATATATTPACPDTTAPSVPANLAASASSCSQVNLSWAASTDTRA